MMIIGQHEPTNSCADIHCYSCGLDESAVGAYIACFECGHCYPSKHALRKAYRREVAPWRRYPFPTDEPWWSAWWSWLRTPRASRIFFCQECSHDF